MELATASDLSVRTRVFRVFLVLFIGSILFSLSGTLLTRLSPGAAAQAGALLPYLIKTPTWIYMASLPVLVFLAYLPELRLPGMLFFLAWGALMGAMAELIGTTTGLPFGAYSYTPLLGPKIMGHVPYFIPLSWFAMSVLSLDLARRLPLSRLERIVAASIFMVLWDVALDPAMSRGMPFWLYHDTGFFYGMPAQNWIGWFITSLVIFWGYEVLGGGLPAPSRWAPLLWMLNAAFPLLLSFMYGLYAAAWIGVFAASIPVLLLLSRGNGESLLPMRAIR